MRFLVLITAITMIPVISTNAINGLNNNNNINCLDCHHEIIPAENSHFLESCDDCYLCHEGRIDFQAHEIATNSDDVICVSCHMMKPVYDLNTAHEDLLCITCHSPHGSNNEFMLTSGEIGVCSNSCHTKDDLGNSHPVGENTVDQNTGKQVTCTSTCHSIHNWTEPKFLRHAGVDLCNNCHAEKS